MLGIRKYWWIWLVIAGAVVWVAYQILSSNTGIKLTSCFTLGSSQKTIAPTAPASAATSFVCGYTCTINPTNAACTCGGANYV